MAEEGCKQCVPCKAGSRQLLRATREMLGAEAPTQDLVALNMVADAAEKTSNCAHGKALGRLFKGFNEFIQSKKK